MILNNQYYKDVWDKFTAVKTHQKFNSNTSCLTTKLILHFYNNRLPIHVNFQNSKETLFEIAKHLFIEFANDIYLNHYDLPDNYNVGDKLKRRLDNQYYEIVNVDNDSYRLKQILSKKKKEQMPGYIPEINYDRLVKNFIKIDAGKGIRDKTLKNYFNFFEKLNNVKNEFPKTNFEKKSVFIAKKTLWDSITEKAKIPSIYMPNPREEHGISETKSIPALSDCLTYFTPKYEVCYQNILSKGKKIKTIILFDTEADKIQQMLLDKVKFGFNLIVLSNSLAPLKTEEIPCWNWFKEETEILNAL